MNVNENTTSISEISSMRVKFTQETNGGKQELK